MRQVVIDYSELARRKVRLGPLALALGVFDGVHLGHRAIIADAVKLSQELGLAGAALTFRNHPLSVIDPQHAPSLLDPFTRRCGYLREAGLSQIIAVSFDEAFSRLSPRHFLEQVLGGALQAGGVAVGENFHFGFRAAGDTTLLKDWGARAGIAVRVSPPVRVGGQVVSSTRIREAVERGEVDLARVLLGRPFQTEGKVIHGQGRGQSLGVMTANLEIPAGLVRPVEGIYAVRVRLKEQTLGGAAYVGSCPTFAGTELRLEVHLLDFHGSLYGENLRLEWIARVRPEQTFDSPAELMAQMRIDLARTREILAGVEATLPEGP